LDLRLPGDPAQLEVSVPGAREPLDLSNGDALRLQLEPVAAELPAVQSDGTPGLDAPPSQRARGFSELHALTRQAEARLDVAQRLRPVTQEQVAAVNRAFPGENRRRRAPRRAKREIEHASDLANLGPHVGQDRERDLGGGPSVQLPICAKGC